MLRKCFKGFDRKEMMTSIFRVQDRIYVQKSFRETVINGIINAECGPGP
jgi:hypothetical protein